jgi:hypothetical protein
MRRAQRLRLASADVRQRGFDLGTLAYALLSWSRYFLLLSDVTFIAKKCYACSAIDVTSDLEEGSSVFLRNIRIHP